MTVRETGRPFAIIASQRTGSTVLVRTLDAAQEIFCAGELFHGGPNVHHAEFRFRRASRIRDALLRIAPSAYERWSVERHLKGYFSTAGLGVQAVGLKVMVSQLRRFPSILPALETLGAVLLFLYRGDSLATALSYAKAKASGVYHSDRAGRRPPAPSIELDLKDFADLVKRCESEKATIRALHETYGGTLLAYEDMAEGWDDFIRTVGNALGLPNLKLAPAMRKLNDGGPVVQISNERELRRTFSCLAE